MSSLSPLKMASAATQIMLELELINTGMRYFYIGNCNAEQRKDAGGEGLYVYDLGISKKCVEQKRGS